MDEISDRQADKDMPLADIDPDQASLDAQASDDAAAAGILFNDGSDRSQNYIDPTTGQTNEDGFARDGQGAPDPTLETPDAGEDPAAPPPLDGE